MLTLHDLDIFETVLPDDQWRDYPSSLKGEDHFFQEHQSTRIEDDGRENDSFISSAMKDANAPILPSTKACSRVAMYS